MPRRDKDIKAEKEEVEAQDEMESGDVGPDEDEVEVDKESDCDMDENDKNDVNANKFALEDDYEVGIVGTELRDTLKTLVQGANDQLRGLVDAGPEYKKEKVKMVKAYHNAAVEIVGTRLKVESVPGVVQGVYEDMDLERLALDEEDDETFLNLLEEFDENCMKEVDKKWNEITLDVVDVDEEYQDCLEVLNNFLDRSKQCEDPPEEPPAATPCPPKQSKKRGNKRLPASSPSSEGEEGFEQLTDHVNLHDPITRRPFTDPYVHRVCGHVYEYGVTCGLINSGKLFRCVYAGCKNNDLLVIEDLVRDEAVRMKIAEGVKHLELLD